MSDLDGGAMARLACEHHWVFQLGPHIPPEIGSVGVCSLCGDVNGADLAEKLAEVERERDELLAAAMADGHTLELVRALAVPAGTAQTDEEQP